MDLYAGQRELLTWSNIKLLTLQRQLLQAAAFFMPTLWLPTYVTDMHFGGSKGPATVVAFNSAAVASRILLGFLVDHTSPHLLGAASSSLAGIFVFLLWGVAGQSIAAILVFSIVFGAVAGGYSSLWSGAIREAVDDDLQAVSALFGLCTLTRGIGALISGPVSSALVTGHSGASNYKHLIIYTGTVLISSATVQLVDAFYTKRKKKHS